MLAFNLFLAGVIIILTPGPVFVASISLISERGRLEGLKLISGALIGDAFWLFLTFLFFIEASRLPDYFFPVLAICCAFYIFYLAYKLYAHAKDKIKNKVFKKPFYDGLAVGLLNPKTYPVNIAIFSALIYDYIETMTWGDFPFVFAVAMFGFFSGYLIINLIAGFSKIKDFYKQHLSGFSYLFSAIFVYFGIMLIYEAFVA
ncbi:MAG: LysE family transporter [Pseudomonadota bacterium]